MKRARKLRITFLFERQQYSLYRISLLWVEEHCVVEEMAMRADIFIDKTHGDSIEIIVVRDGLSSGPAHKYDSVEKARSVLVAFGLDSELVDRQLQSLSSVAPGFLLRFPAAEMADDILQSLGFWAAAFQAA
jgi:hypothetical protein